MMPTGDIGYIDYTGLFNPYYPLYVLGASTLQTAAIGVGNFGLVATLSAPPTIASATTIAPTTPVIVVSGTAAIDTITAPSPISATGGSITIVATGAWSCTTGGNVASTFTAVANKSYVFTYLQATAKWYPPIP